MGSTRAIAKTRDAPQLRRLGKPAEEPAEKPAKGKKGKPAASDDEGGDES